MIQDFIRHLNQLVEQVSGGNQMIAGAVVLWALGTSTYLLKALPLRLWFHLKKQSTTTLDIVNDDPVFYQVAEWLQRQPSASKSRRIKLGNGYSNMHGTMKSIGYGTHLVWVGWIPLLVSLNKETNSTYKVRETITITKLGRSHKVFDSLAEDIKINEREVQRRVYVHTGDYWGVCPKAPIRPFDTIALPRKEKELLIKTIDDFVKSEDWYVERAIPYQLSILLHGPPGTGKTSLIKAIGDYLGKHLAVCPTASATSLPKMMMKAPTDCIYVIEDIDSNSASCDRDAEKEESEIEAIASVYTGGSQVSELLNAIDGLMQHHGRVLIMTTNHPEKLDPAMVRPGRVDLSVEVSYLDTESFMSFLGRFFDDVPTGLELINPTLTGAELQQDVLRGMKLQEITDKHAMPCLPTKIPDHNKRNSSITPSYMC